METVALPYKLQIFIPENLRHDLKEMAHDKGMSLQKLVTGLLADAVAQHAAPQPIAPVRQRRGV